MFTTANLVCAAAIVSPLTQIFPLLYPSKVVTSPYYCDHPDCQLCVLLQTKLADKEASEREAARLHADNLQLSARLVEMKEGEMARVVETNRMCEQMVRNGAIQWSCQ